jgi:hypothetical protein
MHGSHPPSHKGKKPKVNLAYRLLVVVLAKSASATCISSKAIFKLLSSGPILKTPAFGAIVLSQRTPIHAGSLGRVQKNQLKSLGWSCMHL